MKEAAEAIQQPLFVMRMLIFLSSNHRNASLIHFSYQFIHAGYM